MAHGCTHKKYLVALAGDQAAAERWSTLSKNQQLHLHVIRMAIVHPLIFL